jgi:uncharacterized protein YjgD (DUF1641 family)
LTEQKTSRIKDIKETVCGAVEIIRQLRATGVQESFGNIMDTAMITKEIIESLRTPEMVKNIENFRLISENIIDASTKMENTLKQLEEKGVIDEAKRLIRSVTSTTDSFVNCGKNLYVTSNAIKETVNSIRVLVDQFRSNTVS